VFLYSDHSQWTQVRPYCESKTVLFSDVSPCRLTNMFRGLCLPPPSVCYTALHSERQGTSLRAEHPSNRTPERMELRAHSATASTTSLSSSYMGVVGRMSQEVSLKYPATTLSCETTTQWTVDNFWTLNTNKIPTRYQQDTCYTCRRHGL